MLRTHCKDFNNENLSPGFLAPGNKLELHCYGNPFIIFTI